MTPTIKALLNQTADALTKSQQLPKVVSPLTQSEIHFLQTHTFDQLVVVKEDARSPLLQFVLQVAQAAATAYITQALLPESHSKEKAPSDNTQQNRSLASIEQKHTGKAVMKTASKATVTVLDEKMTDLAKTAAQNQATDAILQGDTASHAYIHSRNESTAFYNGVKKGIKAGVASGVFAHRVEQDGFEHAVKETVKDGVLDFLTKNAASGISKITGYGNTAVLGAGIAAFFDPTETAPPLLDERPPPRIPFPPKSSLPNLRLPNSLYPPR